MIDDKNDIGMGTLFLLVLQKKYGEIKESAKPKLKKMFKIIACVFGGIFLLALMFIISGTSLGINEVTLIGRLGIIFIGGCLLWLAIPIGYALAGRRYITFIRYCVLYQVSAVFVLWFTPLPITLSIMCGISFVGFLIAVINALAKDKRIKYVTTAVFLFLLSSAFVPRLHNVVYSKVIEYNQPQLLQLHHGQVKEITFFLNHKPVVWSSIDDADKKYVLYDGKGFDRYSNKEFEPMTPPLADLLRRNEELISPRNFFDQQVKYEFGKSSEIPNQVPTQTQARDAELERNKAELEKQKQELREAGEKLARERKELEEARVAPTPAPIPAPPQQTGPYQATPPPVYGGYAVACEDSGPYGPSITQSIANRLGGRLISPQEAASEKQSRYVVIVQHTSVVQILANGRPTNFYQADIVLSISDNVDGKTKPFRAHSKPALHDAAIGSALKVAVNMLSHPDKIEERK